MIQFERAVLSGLCQFGGEAFSEIDGILDSACFTDDTNAILFKLLEDVYRKNPSAKIDIPTILAAANSNGFPAIATNPDDKNYIKSLMVFPIEKDNVFGFAKKLKVVNIAEVLAQKLDLCKSRLLKVTGDESVDEVLSIAESEVFDYSANIGAISNRTQKIGTNSKEYLEWLMTSPMGMPGISTGYKLMDAALGGGLLHGMTLVAAKTKTGKSFLAMNVAAHISEILGLPVLIVDTEMSEDDILNRLYAYHSGVKLDRIRFKHFREDPSEVKAMQLAQQKIETLPLFHERVSGRKFREVISIIRRWIIKDVGFDGDAVKPCAVIYDYFKLAENDAASNKTMAEYQLMGYQASAIHDFCKELKIPVLGFVQQNEEGKIAQSARLGWNAINICLFDRKTEAEYIADGKQNGTRKFTPIWSRHAPDWDYGNYINFKFDGAKGRLIELNTKADLRGTEEDAGNDKVEF